MRFFLQMADRAIVLLCPTLLLYVCVCVCLHSNCRPISEEEQNLRGAPIRKERTTTVQGFVDSFSGDCGGVGDPANCNLSGLYLFSSRFMEENPAVMEVSNKVKEWLRQVSKSKLEIITSCIPVICFTPATNISVLSTQVPHVEHVRGGQFFLGDRGSGAPMHFHRLAINLLAFGAKRWYGVQSVFRTWCELGTAGTGIVLSRTLCKPVWLCVGRFIYPPHHRRAVYSALTTTSEWIRANDGWRNSSNQVWKSPNVTSEFGGLAEIDLVGDASGLHTRDNPPPLQCVQNAGDGGLARCSACVVGLDHVVVL